MCRKLFFSISLVLLGTAVVHAHQTQEAMLGMRIEKIVEEKGTITVLTTGARFLINASGTLLCWQRIPKERKVLEVKLSEIVSPLRIEKKDNFACTVSCQAVTLTLQGDGVVILKLNKDFTATFRGLFKPSYHAQKDGKWLLIDPYGGFGIYPVTKKETSTPNFASPPWNIVYNFEKGEEVWLSIFPPRPYNWERAFESLAHEGGNFPEYAYPSNELIRSAAKHCKIFAVHSHFWEDASEEVKPKTGKYAGRRCPHLTAKHVPADMKQFIRMRQEVHRHGMKLVVYLSPYYSKAPDIFAEMKRVLEEYKVDGLYFDGVSMDFRKSYHIMRQARKILGDDHILYVHCTSDPLGDGRIYCPFIDTYADYILRGEAGRYGLDLLEDFLRWTVSGYNISNAVGYWCYYGSTGKPGYVPQVPTTKHINAALRNEVRIWRQECSWKQAGGDVARFDKEYYGELKLLHQSQKQQSRQTSAANDTHPDIVAGYDFDEGAGDLLHDRSGKRTDLNFE